MEVAFPDDRATEDAEIRKLIRQMSSENAARNRFSSLCGFPLDPESQRDIVKDDLRPSDADKMLDRMLDDHTFKKQFLHRLHTMMTEPGSGNLGRTTKSKK